MKLPDLEGWAIFAKVCQMGSFARTADELGLSKATVSKAITRLEQRLGVPLLHRTSRRLSLTENGRLARERATQILAEGEAIEAEAITQAASPRGLVKVSAPMSFGIGNLAPILPDFLARYPEVSLDLELNDKTVDLIGDGFDLAIRIGSLADSSLRVRQLCAIRRPLVATPDYLARHGRPSHPRDLERHECLIYTYTANPTLLRLHHPVEGEVTVQVSGRMQSNNAETLNAALLAGQGIALQPDFLIWKHIADGRLEELLPGWSGPAISLNVVTPPGRIRPPRVDVLIAFLKENFTSPPWAA